MAQAQMTPGEYIARAATARVVYVELFNVAMSLLPPLTDEDIECYYTVTDLAKRIEQSKSMVQNDLRWLKAHGWITTHKGAWRFLGRRQGEHLYLMADLAAKIATGEDRLVSREILDIKVEAPVVTEETTRRGAGRRWRGTETTFGGAFDLGS